MKTQKQSSIKALVSLLEDPSEIVYAEIRQSIKSLGAEAIPYLQTALDQSDSDLQKIRISQILENLKLNTLRRDLQYWAGNEPTNLLEGLLIIAAYGYPNFDRSEVDEVLSAIEATMSDKIDGKSSLDIVEIMNQVILKDFRFTGNRTNYAASDNSYINKIIANRTSNPIGLSALYLMVAMRLKIPMIGINTPGHFMIGYVNDYYFSEKLKYGNLVENIDFFVDPFYNGAIRSTLEFDHMLEQLSFDLQHKDKLPASNLQIVKRVLNNLIHSLYKSGKENMGNELLIINESL